MRVDDAQQRLGDLRELVIDLEVDTGGEERERLQQPFDVGIFAFVRLEVQARRDLRILLGKLRAHPAQEAELAFVVQQQFVAHVNRPSG